MQKQIHKDNNCKFVYKCDYCKNYFDEGVMYYDDWSEFKKDGLVIKNVYICNECFNKNLKSIKQHKTII